MIQILEYDNIKLADVHADDIVEWETGDADYIRVAMPSTTKTQLTLFNKGYFLADRTLGVQINLSNSKINYSSLIRMKLIESSDYKNEILNIAKESFPDDRRFHFKPIPDPEVAELILADWIYSQETALICMYKDLPIGFLMLKQMTDNMQFVYLAAVAKKYRATGASMSLYSAAADICQKKGYKFLEGRISSRNTAVMNLYAFLGGKFKDPEDIYLKEINKNAD